MVQVNGQDVRLASHRQVADLLVDSGPIVILELAVCNRQEDIAAGLRWLQATATNEQRISLDSLFECLSLASQDNYAVDEIDTEDISIDNEEDFFNKIAQVGEEAMMAMLEGEIAEDRAAANECNGAEPADTAAAAQ